MDYQNEIGTIIALKADISASEAGKLVEIPKEAGMGDYAFPCFRLAKALKKPPQVIAVELAQEITLTPVFERVCAVGPYLNFFVSREDFARRAVSEILQKGETYGASGVGAGKTVVIDYSSPNITHEFHIGHLFSTVIGAALYRIYKFLGYNTVGINYIGDWGAQFGKLLCGYTRWSGPEALEKDGLDELTRVYVKFHEEAEKDPELEKEARACFVKIEQGDAEAVRLWKLFCGIFLGSMETIYKRLGISFDSYNGESYYSDKMAPVVEEIKEKGLLQESEGAMIVNLEEYKMPACLILRSDGGTLYPTRDIAAALDRKRVYDFHKSLYVTDVRQSLHFAQFFKVLGLMGYEWAEDLVHIPYGLLSLDSGPLSARKGNVILLKDLFDEAARSILSIINEKNNDLPDKEGVAEDVGIGAVVFGVLYTSRIKDLVFSWDKALNFDGETGPYVQYTHARASSVLEKSGGTAVSSGLDYGALTDEAAMELIKTLSQFPERVLEAAEKYEPFIVSRSLVSIAQAFNKFYHENPILTSPEGVKEARLVLVKCVKDVLKAGLALLGVRAPEKM